jgi:predicted ArsR family transcriptional regulator
MDPDSPQQLPAELRAFLHSCIDSTEQIELLMMLRGSDRFRTAREAASDLRVPPAIARRDLDILAARGLLEASVGEETSYRYRPKSAELARYADLLAQHYITSRHVIFKLVSTQSRLAARRFADAFRLRGTE